MILSALNQYYETLCARGELSVPGWTDNFKVTFGLDLGDNGEIVRVIDYREEVPRGKKMVTVPRLMRVPTHPTRTSGAVANFLCDNSAYMLGVEKEGASDKALKCFAANKTLHEKLLENVDEPAAQAVLEFFRNWRIEEAESHPALCGYWETILRGVNLIFCYEGVPLTETMAIQEAWQEHFDAPDPFAPKGTCLITGKIGPIASIHPLIKGVKGAKATGAGLSSFNCPSFCSYGKEQNFNAPVSERVAFGYTTALNYLLSDRAHTRVVGDTTIVCWAEHGDPSYQDAYMSVLFGTTEVGPDGVLTSLLSNLSKGEPVEWDGSTLDANEHFYVLGISPNAARLSVRFFYKDSFGSIVQNIQKHYQDLAIVKPVFDPWEHLPLWKLLSETVDEKSTKPEPLPQLSGEVLRSILTGAPYPATLLNGVMLRIRADKEITRGRAAIIKAFYTRANIPFPKEVLSVEGNSNCTNVPYTLGRLFYVYEHLQERAMEKKDAEKHKDKDQKKSVNASVKDKYFNAASATPALVMPTLNNLAQHHLRKLRREHPGTAIYFEQMLCKYSCIIGESYPERLTVSERGSFYLGYYFEKDARFKRKDNKGRSVEHDPEHCDASDDEMEE